MIRDLFLPVKQVLFFCVRHKGVFSIMPKTRPVFRSGFRSITIFMHDDAAFPGQLLLSASAPDWKYECDESDAEKCLYALPDGYISVPRHHRNKTEWKWKYR